jgi:putative ABC transport system permease protein
VSGASLFAATAGQSIKGDIGDTIAADRVVRAAGSAPGLPPEVARAADDVRGVTAVALRSAPTRLGGENVTVTGTRLGHSVLAIDVETGRLPSRPGEVAIAADLAARTGWDVGARLPLTTPDGRGQARVTATFAGTDALSDVLATPATVNGLGAANLHDAVLLDGAAANLREVERALADQPTAVVETVDEYAASTAGPLNAVLSLVLGLLGVAVLVAVLGIATTVGLSVHERTRELGGLRAIGMERRQLRRAIRSEAVLVALVGAGVGLVIGLGATLTALEAMGDLGSPVLPGPALAATLIGAVLAGTLAAAAPARRAARMPVLDAMRA